MIKDKHPSIDFDGELELLDLDGRPESAPADFSLADSEVPYQGPERRIRARRRCADRRVEIRFEEKMDRRSGGDRRKGTWINNNTF